MRSYAQFCGVAKALDVIGDRWTLLIVRELLIRGSARYTDLKAGLPGVASNLLAERLRELQVNGLVVRVPAVPPVATPLFSLTERGRELQLVLAAVGRWGAALLGDSAADNFQSHWLALPLTLELHDRFPEQPPITVEIRTGEEPLTLQVNGGVVTAVPGSAAHPDAMISGAPPLVVALLLGGRPLHGLTHAGLDYTGDPAILDRIRPVRESAAA